MSVGRQMTKQRLDEGAADVVIRLREALADADQLRTWVADQSDEDLAGLGYDTDDVYLLRVATQDLGLLFDVWAGAVAVTPAKDFRQYAKKLSAID